MSTKKNTVFTFDRMEPFYMTPEQNLKFLSNGWGDFTDEELKEVQAVMREPFTDEDMAEIQRSIDFALNYAKKCGKKVSE